MTIDPGSSYRLSYYKLSPSFYQGSISFHLFKDTQTVRIEQVSMFENSL